jgi:hypothetical protein
MNLVDARGYLALARSKIANNNGEAAADVIVVNLAMSLEYVIRFFEHLTVDRS